MTRQTNDTLAEIKDVVLVHGGFVDGSGWEGVHSALVAKGFAVRITQHPTISLNNDAEAVRRVIDDMDGPVVLVGHSYGGAVISAAGHHDKVAALVYIAAFAPDAGESVGDLVSHPEPGAPVPPILPPQHDFLFLDRDKFAASFAGDVEPSKAAFMADSQVPWGIAALNGAIEVPAWKLKPSWYLVTIDDRMIPAAAQRRMASRANSTIVETAGSHAVYVANPTVVATIIEQAAQRVAVQD